MKWNLNNMIATTLRLAAGTFFATGSCARVYAQEQPKAAAQIAALLDKCVTQQRRAPGIVIGIVDESGPKIFAQGVCEIGQTPAVNGDTVFEIGSVTKVFTAVLLQEMADSGEVSLEDPIIKYLPPNVKTPTRDGKNIRLVDLATQTSGLPRLPDNLNPKDDGNPYADYTVEQLYDFLGRAELQGGIGEQYLYSNLGVGLLGHVLALRAGTNYESLIVRRICDPLQMNSTRITLSHDLKERLTPGHGQMGQTVKNWDCPTLAGCGALRSTANDLLKFLAANIGLTHSGLSNAMAATHRPRHHTGDGMEIGLIWQIRTDSGILWHNGGTGGYRSFIGFRKDSRRGVVVLANSQNAIDDLGFYLLGDRPDVDDFEPPKERKVARIDPKVYDDYVGFYKSNITPVTITVTRDGNRLLAQVPGQDKYEIFPESEKDFFYKVVDAQLTFNRDASGAVTYAVLHQAGMDIKIDRGEPPKERKVARIDPKVYDDYVGTYKFARAPVTITVTRNGDRLFAQMTGQGKNEIFPESEKDFFLKVVDAQLTFNRSASGAVTDVVLHQMGIDQKVVRVSK